MFSFEILVKLPRPLLDGTAEDIKLSASLFEEWSMVIVAMAEGRFGNAFYGNGLRYSYGFANSLYDQTKKQTETRNLVLLTATSALVKYGSNLNTALLAKREKATEWLNTNRNVKLQKGQRHRYRYTEETFDAFTLGRNDGSKADFSANRQRKLNHGEH